MLIHFKECEKTASTELQRKVYISDILILPVQRIPRYQLLLEAVRSV
jgi:hypothetical protein